MCVFDSWNCPMVKTLINYRIISFLLLHIKGFVEFSIIYQMFFPIHIEEIKSLTLTQLVNFIEFHLATIDLCHCMNY